MVEIKIDKAVPIPVHGGNNVNKYAGAVRSLEVGDSFWLPKDSVGKGYPGAIRNLSLAIGIKTIIRELAPKMEFSDGAYGGLKNRAITVRRRLPMNQPKQTGERWK